MKNTKVEKCSIVGYAFQVRIGNKIVARGLTKIEADSLAFKTKHGIK